MDLQAGSPPPEYLDRRAAIAARAAGPGAAPADIGYSAAENHVWAQVVAALVPLWHRVGADAALRGLDRLSLDRTRVPQLREVTEALAPHTGFRFEAVPGLVDPETFFGALAERRFLSTQYVRWEGSPLYTPEPDVIHEVVGHGHLLTDLELAELHRLAGSALTRVATHEARQFVADVFWFSGEFGVVRERGTWRAYGAGLLSSVGELEWFPGHARIEPLDLTAMGTLAYDISHYQPVLFGARSITEVLDVVGRFFADCTDDSIAAMRARAPDTTTALTDPHPTQRGEHHDRRRPHPSVEPTPRVGFH